ncbi:MAG: putative quinol monooxygenase [Pirellulales bacterium]
MIHVLATIQLAPGRRADFLAEFDKIVSQVHAERGCLEYGPAIEMNTPIAAAASARDDFVTVIEKWESVQALQDHLAAPHMTSYRETVKDLVAGVEIRVMEPA